MFIKSLIVAALGAVGAVAAADECILHLGYCELSGPNKCCDAPEYHCVAGPYGNKCDK
jgi:hypothetical protein